MKTTPAIRPVAENLGNVSDLASALLGLGYPIIETNEDQGTISTVIETNGKKFAVLLDINEDGTALRIESQVGIIGDLPVQAGDHLVTELTQFLILNSRIAPYAVTMYPPDSAGSWGDSTSAENTPIVLINEVPLGDLSNAELESAMMTLRKAIILVTDSIQSFRS